VSQETAMSQESGAEEQNAVPAPVPLNRNSGFRMLWIGQLLSDTGSTVALIAYPLLILALTHSPGLAGAAGTARLIVQLVIGLPGGALSDRFDRRLTMIVSDAFRAGLLVLLGVLVLLHHAAWPVVMIVAVLDGAANVLFDPAANAALPAIVADSQLERAWAATEARTYTASLVGPALGGFLFGLGSAVPFLGDALSYLVSVGTVSRIRGNFRPKRSGEPTSLWHDIAEGLHLVWQNKLLRGVVIQAPLINFAFTGVIFTITVALREHGTSPSAIGLVQAGVMVGGLAGAVVAPRLQGRLRLSQLAIGLTTIGTVLFVATALLLPSLFVAAPVALALFLSPTANAALFAAMLRAAPENLRGRVTNTVVLGATALAALAPLTGGLLVQHVSGRWAMLAFAAALGVAAVISVLFRSAWDVEPSAPPEAADAGVSQSPE
jgi:MFS family permease